MVYSTGISRSGPLRAVQVCESRYLICPRCGARLHRVFPHRGTAFAACEQKGPYKEGLPNPRCGQKVLILAMPQGVSIVVGITIEELERYATDERPARDLFRELGGVFPNPGKRVITDIKNSADA